MPWLALVAIVSLSDIPHYQRIAHPISRTGVLTVGDEFTRGPDPSVWIVETRGDATIIPDGGAVVLTTGPGAAAYLDLIQPGQPDPSRSEPWVPRGLYANAFDEHLEWDATLGLAGEYSVVLQTRQLLMQATRYGLHLMYPDVRGHNTEHHVEMPDLADGRTRRYQLERSGGLIRLRIGEATAWTHPDGGRFDLIRFGETRPDALHAGRLRLDRVSYVRRYVSPV